MAGGGKDEWHPLRGARKPPPEVTSCICTFLSALRSMALFFLSLSLYLSFPKPLFQTSHTFSQVRIMFKISVKALAPALSPPIPLEPAKPPPTSESPPRALAKKQPSVPRPPPPTKEEAIDMVLAAASEHGAETSDMRDFALSVDLRTVRSAESVGSNVFLR